MSRIEKFEEIQAWQEARLLAGQTYALCQTGELAQDFGLRDANYITSTTFEKRHQQSLKVANLIGGFLRYLQQSKNK